MNPDPYPKDLVELPPALQLAYACIDRCFDEVWASGLMERKAEMWAEFLAHAIRPEDRRALIASVPSPDFERAEHYHDLAAVLADSRPQLARQVMWNSQRLAKMIKFLRLLADHLESLEQEGMTWDGVLLKAGQDIGWDGDL